MKLFCNELRDNNNLSHEEIYKKLEKDGYCGEFYKTFQQNKALTGFYVADKIDPKNTICFVGCHADYDDVVNTVNSSQKLEFFKREYLAPLKIDYKDINFINIIPLYLAKSVDDSVLLDWETSLFERIPINTKYIISLSKRVFNYLQCLEKTKKFNAAYWLPHPNSIRNGGSSKEYDVLKKHLAMLNDKHITSEQDGAHNAHSANSANRAVISKMMEKGLVCCVLSEPNIPDAHGDIMTDDTIENYVHEFMKLPERKIFLQHEKEIDADLVECWVERYGNDDIKKGSSVAVIQVNDLNIREQIKNGQLTGFSIGGWGVPIALKS